MNLTVTTHIKASKETVWKIISDIENSPHNISGIEKVEVLEKPNTGLVGLKWTETRTLFGKTATETMCITEAREPEYYQTYSESHGAVYEARLQLKEHGEETELSMRFEGRPVTLSAKIMSALLGWMMMGATRKALQKDMDDIKTAAERATA